MKAERVIGLITVLVRDVVPTLTGSFGVGWMLYHDSVDPTAMLVMAALLGIPGALGARRLAQSAESGTPGSGSDSAPASSPLPSPSPPSSN